MSSQSEYSLIITRFARDKQLWRHSELDLATTNKASQLRWQDTTCTRATAASGNSRLCNRLFRRKSRKLCSLFSLLHGILNKRRAPHPFPVRRPRNLCSPGHHVALVEAHRNATACRRSLHSKPSAQKRCAVFPGGCTVYIDPWKGAQGLSEGFGLGKASGCA